jgi:hypothetical protein
MCCLQKPNVSNVAISGAAAKVMRDVLGRDKLGLMCCEESSQVLSGKQRPIRTGIAFRGNIGTLNCLRACHMGTCIDPQYGALSICKGMDSKQDARHKRRNTMRRRSWYMSALAYA